MQKIPYTPEIKAVAGNVIKGILFNNVYWSLSSTLGNLIEYAKKKNAHYYIVIPDDGNGRKILAATR